MALGLYLSVPFCRSKCSYCNFASQVFAPALYGEYCELLAREIALAATADGLRGSPVDTIYWGGGTPSLLPPAGFARVIAALRENFAIAPDAEHTVEVAPGTLPGEMLAALVAGGVNRVSLGVQSFVDAEARAVGRLHGAAAVATDLATLRAAGIHNLNLDLIAGLPHQTTASWQSSLDALCDSGVPHASVYMLEVDEDSRLGGELLAGGARYHAHHVPDDTLITGFYETAGAVLQSHGLAQYEISNFARPGAASQHNHRYWARRPYLGVGLDAHSMLAPAAGWRPAAVRFCNPDALPVYMDAVRAGRLARGPVEIVSAGAALEEMLFLGLRRNAGVSWADLELAGGAASLAWLAPRCATLCDDGLLCDTQGTLRLTPRGRLLSNLVFEQFLGCPAELQPIT